MSAPAFAKGVRFRRAPDGQGMLLIPEGVVNLNASAAAIVELINGQRTVSEITTELCARHDADATNIARDVTALLEDLRGRNWIVFSRARQSEASEASKVPSNCRPLSLLAELTYRCNLQCPYCYNPLDLGSYRDELHAATWCRVVDEAAQLGILQLHLSGGEPTLRPDDCCAIVQRARERDLYTNLITQGTFLTESLIDRLLGAGLDHVQISLQGAKADTADSIAGTKVHERKLDALRRAVRRDVAVTLNCVLHARNIDEVDWLIALAEELGVRRLELAHTQFYGWAFRNRAALLPTRDQVERATTVIRDARQRLAGSMEITHVLADYYEAFPKPCMNGWGRQFMTVTPDGRVLPCPAATAITSLRFENVQDRSLADIWHRSDAFNAYRGTQWMPQPCQSCDRRELDWGGCRCQAFLLAGNAGVTDPACSLSPDHHLVAEAISSERELELVPRRS